ncbi:MAG: AMP-binding protein [Candidatus Limnocylindrales bacterium]
MNIPELIDRAGRWYGDSVAVVDGTRERTFRLVAERSSRVANALLELSPQAGARVALLMPNRMEFVECDFGIAKAGKVRVPINPRLADDEREYILADSGAETLVFDVEFEDFVSRARQRLPELCNLVAVGGAAAGAKDYEELVASASPATPRLAHEPSAPNFILYTSGTTGRPKGATATNGSRLAATLSMLRDEVDAEACDGMVHLGAMAHGSGSKVLAYFLRGARNITERKFDAERFLHLVETERSTATFVVPTMIAMLVDAARSRSFDLSALKTISYGGAPIAPEKLQEALETFGNVFVQVYGSCEAPHPILVLRKSEHRVPRGKERRLASIGREVTTSEVRIVGEDGADVADGEHGEMWVRGPNVMRGYWGNPKATAEVLSGDGWYRTGDVAIRDDEGFYYMVDRARDMIISGGLNIYPAEVERAIYTDPAVAEVAVIGVPDERWGESVKAFVVLKQPGTLTELDVIEHARGLLASYKKPRSVEFVDALPKGSTGKILKRELQAPYWEGRARRV